MRKYDNVLIKVIALLMILALLLGLCSTQVEASTIVEPMSNQYFELRATDTIEREDGTKQMIMELWGHNLDFKRIWSKV